MAQLNVTKLAPNAQLPVRGSSGAAGYDLFSIDSYVVLPGRRVVVSTGISIHLPPGTYASIRPRSGLAVKHGLDTWQASSTQTIRARSRSSYRTSICSSPLSFARGTVSPSSFSRITPLLTWWRPRRRAAPLRSLQRLVETPGSVRLVITRWLGCRA